MRIFRRIAAENPKHTRKFFCQNLPGFTFSKQKKNGFSRQKPTCGTGPPQNCHRMPHNAAELPQNSATHSPKTCKTDQVLPDCVQKNHFFKICPKFLSFCRSKKVAPKVANRVFWTDGKRGCLRNSQRKSVKCGNGLRWETVGATLAPTMRLTKSAAKYAGG